MALTFEQDASGRRLATKWASTATELARLRHEAEMLDRARHPGVVELVDVAFDETSGVVRMAAVSGSALDRFRAMSPSEVAGLIAAVAETVSDLHLMGIVHGSIDRHHVLVDDDGRPVLCGLADASPIEGCDPSADVQAVGLLMSSLLPSTVRTPEVEVLRALAAWATSPDRRHRPSAAELAAAITERVRNASLPRPTVDSPTTAAAPNPRWKRAAGVGVAVALLAATAALVVNGSAEAGPRPAAARRAGSPPPRRPTTTITRRERRCYLEASPTRADFDGDGCDEPYSFVDGTLVAGQRRWLVGTPGDLAAVARWGCQRRASLALVRPTTGQVWMFSGWAQAGRPVTGRLVGTVPDAASVGPGDPDHDGCAEVVVTRADGPAVVLAGDAP